MLREELLDWKAAPIKIYFEVLRVVSVGEAVYVRAIQRTMRKELFVFLLFVLLLEVNGAGEFHIKLN